MNPMDETYGSTHRIRRFWLHLSKLKWDITYVEPNNFRKEIISFKQSNNAPGFLYGTFKRMLITLMRKYDILYIQTITPLTVPAIVCARLRRKKVVIDWDDLSWVLQKNPLRSILVKFCEHEFIKFADALFVPNKYLLGYAQSLGAKEVHFVPHGVDFDLFDPSNYDSGALKREIGLSDSPTLGFLASFTTGGVGDLEFIYSAVRKVLEYHPNINFLVIGGGPLFDDYKRLAAEVGLKNTYFTGLLTHREIPKYVQCLDIALIFMSDDLKNKMKTSLKTGEYLAMNKIVVGHLVGQTRDDFARYCITCEATLNSFVETICTVLRDELSTRNTRAALSQNYTWENSTAIVDGALKGL
jgi:glycosyltransferase involved in cell wall biosynthesis